MVFFVCFHFYRKFCEKTVEQLVRGRIWRRLVWVRTGCPCPTKWTLDLQGYNEINEMKLSVLYETACVQLYLLYNRMIFRLSKKTIIYIKLKTDVITGVIFTGAMLLNS